MLINQSSQSFQLLQNRLEIITLATVACPAQVLLLRRIALYVAVPSSVVNYYKSPYSLTVQLLVGSSFSVSPGKGANLYSTNISYLEQEILLIVEGISTLFFGDFLESFGLIFIGVGDFLQGILLFLIKSRIDVEGCSALCV